MDGYQGRNKIVECAWCHEHLRYGFLQRHYRECLDFPRLEPSQKICSECQRVLDKSQFPNRSSRPDKLESRCKSCVRTYMQQWVAANHPKKRPEEIVRRPNRWILKPCPFCGELFSSIQLQIHKPRCPLKKPNKMKLSPLHVLSSMEAMRESLTSAEYQQQKERFSDIRKRYGLGRDGFVDLYKSQEGRCPICKQAMTLLGEKSKKAHVDHNHVTGEVRGLLCHTCNIGLGHFREDVALLMAAIGYLTRAKPLPVCS